MPDKKELYIIGGPNGAGKTTFVEQFLPNYAKVHIFFLDLASVNLSLSRVRYRVEIGGHSIPRETILRRYARSKQNFLDHYKDKADNWYLFNNSGKTPALVASNQKGAVEIYDNEYFEHFAASIKEEEKT